MRRLFLLALVLGAALVAMIWAAEYGQGPIVLTREDQYKIILRLGDPVKVLEEPGLSLRIPLLDRVIDLDRRLQYLNAEPVEIVIARGQRLIIDWYALWRISNPLEFRKRYPLGLAQAQTRIQEKVNALVGAKVASLDQAQLLARAEAVTGFDDSEIAELESTGVRIVDVRLNRIELPRKAEPAAYRQMREQRRAISRERRAIGEREARAIRAEAEREARTTLAKARSEAEIIRGQGDAESARIYAQAYAKDPEFYGFVRSLEAYRNTLKEGTTMVLAPDHEFFRYLDPTVPAR